TKFCQRDFEGWRRTSDDAEFAADLAEDVERELQFLARVRCRDDGPDAGLVAGDGGKGKALREDPFFEQAVRQLHRQRALAGGDRRERALADSGVEAELLQTGLEEARVLPEAIDDLRFLLQDVEGGDTGGRDRRRMRGGEEKRPRAMVEELDQAARSGDVA